LYSCLVQGFLNDQEKKPVITFHYIDVALSLNKSCLNDVTDHIYTSQREIMSTSYSSNSALYLHPNVEIGNRRQMRSKL